MGDTHQDFLLLIQSTVLDLTTLTTAFLQQGHTNTHFHCRLHLPEKAAIKYCSSTTPCSTDPPCLVDWIQVTISVWRAYWKLTDCLSLHCRESLVRVMSSTAQTHSLEGTVLSLNSSFWRPATKQPLGQWGTAPGGVGNTTPQSCTSCFCLL